MNLDELRAVQNKERQKDSLQHLRESFYEDVADYVAELEAERDRLAAEADDPFSEPAVRQLSDEIDTVREVAEAIYERRLGKLVKRASLAAADMPADAEGLTAEEEELFEDIVDRIERNKAHVLDVVEGDDDEDDDGGQRASDTDAASVDTAETQTASEGDTDLADVMGAGDDRPPAGGERGDAAGESRHPGDQEATAARGDGGTSGSPASNPETSSQPGGTTSTQAAGGETPPADAGTERTAATGLDERTTIRVTADVGEIYAVDDRDYDLSTDDVVTLPAANAEPLLERNAAERLD